MDAKCADPRLALPTEVPSFHGGWPRVELPDERATLVLGQMVTDLKPGNARAAKVTGVMLLRGFLTLRVAPLQAHARPLWELEEEGNMTRLRPGALPDDELAAVLCLIVGDNQEYPPSAFVPLFQRKDREEFIASRPTFDACGLVPPVLLGAPAPRRPLPCCPPARRAGPLRRPRQRPPCLPIIISGRKTPPRSSPR